MVSIYTQNKRRGRAFQAKLAKMAGGVNIGTLGGEDVMHMEFSYEAKTYKKNCKSNKYQDWVGERILSEYDQGFAKADLVIVILASSNYSSLVVLRWAWWEKLVNGDLSKDDIDGSIRHKYLSKFRGNSYMRQAENNCPDAKVPVVVVHTTGRRHPQDVVLIRGIYWQSLLEKLFDK